MMTAQTKSVIYAYSIPAYACQEAYHIWSVSTHDPFNELLISWNALRPSHGHYVILSRLLIENQWTPWLLYAVWGSTEQFSFYEAPSHVPIRSFQDQVEVLNKKMATGFCIRIVSCGKANLENFYSLYACTSNIKALHPSFSASFQSYSLPVPNISQLRLNHPRSSSICSPTSTTAVIQYFLDNRQLNPLQFAKQTYDAGFDIYGNWSFNVAQAFVELGPQWQCFYARMPSIEWLWYSLKNGRPVVASIRGHLPGTVLPYSNGHLIVIKGYDAQTHHFLCMDPAFLSDQQTEVIYPWQAFIQAWENRHYLAYFFIPKNEKIPSF